MNLLSYNFIMKICFFQEPIADYFEPSNLIIVFVITRELMNEHGTDEWLLITFLIFEKMSSALIRILRN